MYGDTGVFGRNLTTQQLAALRKQGITDKQLKELGYNV
jgi:hypothetical protein